MTDDFVIQTADGTQKTINITIHGSNDSAKIDNPTLTDVVQLANLVSGNNSISGNISVIDVDLNQSSFDTSKTLASPNNIGVLTLAADGSYTYAVSNSASQYLAQGQTKTDTFTVTSLDGTTKNVSFTVTGVNDHPNITGSMSAQGVSPKNAKGEVEVAVNQGTIVANQSVDVGFALQATDPDTRDDPNAIQFSFGTHMEGDSVYSYFHIDQSTGAISLTKLGAESIAGEDFNADPLANVTDYYLNVRATDAYMREDKVYGTELDQVLKIHVNKAVSADGLSAALPGQMRDWNILSKNGGGFSLISIADPALSINLPSSVASLSFADGTLNLSSADPDLTLITDTNTYGQVSHSIHVAQSTTQNLEVDVHSAGQYTIVGAPDSDSDPNLGTVENYRSDTVGILADTSTASNRVFADSSQASFSILEGDLTGVKYEDGYRIEVDIHSPTKPSTTTATLQIDDIEYVQFNDKKVTLIGADIPHNEDTIIDIDKDGNYVVIGSADLTTDDTTHLTRRDILNVNSNLADASFKSAGNGVQMTIKDANGTVTGSTLMREVEEVHFQDATVLIVAANGYESQSSAILNQPSPASDSNPLYLYNPTLTHLDTVYPYQYSG